MAPRSDLRPRAGPGEVALPSPLPGSIPWLELILASASPMLSMGALLNFAPMLPLVEREFDLTHAWSGILISVTAIVHMLLTLPGGQVTDAVGAKRGVVLGQAAVGLAILAGAVAPGFELLLLSRVLLGVGTSLSFVAGLSVVSSIAPPNQRAKCQGIFGAGANSGVLLVLLFSQPLADLGGWRGTFLVEGLLAMVAAAASAAWLRPTASGPRTQPARWGQILRRRPLYLLGLANAFTYGSFMGIAAWTTTLLWETWSLSLGTAASLAAAMAVTAVAGRMIGGALSSGREKATMVLACLGTGICTAVVPLSPTVAIAALILLGLGWFSSISFGAIFAGTSRFSDASSVGRSFGVVAFVANVATAAFPTVIGFVLDLTSSFVVGFGFVALAGVAGAVALYLWLPDNGA